jgi:hypothetical protein
MRIGRDQPNTNCKRTGRGPKKRGQVSSKPTKAHQGQQEKLNRVEDMRATPKALKAGQFPGLGGLAVHALSPVDTL